MSRRRLFNVIALGIGVSVLAFTIYTIGLDDLVEHIGSVGWGFFALLAIGIANFTIDGLALWVAVGKDISLTRAISITMAGAAINQFTPMNEGGEVVKGNMLAGDVPGERAVSSVLAWNLVNRATKHIVIFVGPVLIFFFGSGQFSTQTLLILLVAVVLSAIPTILLFILASSRGAERVTKLFRFLPFVRQATIDKLVVKAKMADSQLKDYLTVRRKDTWRMFWILIVGKLLLIVDFWAAINFLDGGVNIVEAAFLMSGSQVAGVILSVSPVSIGVLEAGETTLWLLLGLSASLGLAQALVRRLRTLTLNFVGLLFLGAEGVRGTNKSSK